MIIYGSSLSPFVRKTLAFAAEKGIELELVVTNPLSDDPEFRAASPFGKIPGFRDGDFTLADSTAIITYLDTLNPEPNLIPTEAKARAKTVWFEEFADTIHFNCASRIFRHRVLSKLRGVEPDHAAADAAEAELPEIFDYLESVIPPSGYLVEDRFTLADMAVATTFVNHGHSGVYTDPKRWPKTAAYVANILARPSFSHWVEREQKFLARVG